MKAELCTMSALFTLVDLGGFDSNFKESKRSIFELSESFTKAMGLLFEYLFFACHN